MTPSICVLAACIRNADRAAAVAESNLRFAALLMAAGAVESIDGFVVTASEFVVAAHELDPSRSCEAGC